MMITARAGVTPKSAQQALPQSIADQHLGAGENVALMAVGGAGLIAGLIIGGGGGAALAVGGAVVGLYGLFNFMK